MTTSHVLDNPVWAALNSQQSAFALGDALAKRYPGDMSVFAGLDRYDEAGFQALHALMRLDDNVTVVTPQPFEIPAYFSGTTNTPIVQMIAGVQSAYLSPVECTPLNHSHIDAVMQLVEMTKPGPFGIRTIDMGRYFGIWQGTQLVAMAGERMRLDGYTEISAVCTHPDHRGKKYSSILINKLSAEIRATQRIPFLHVFEDNVSAIRVYERLGFTKRHTVRVTGLRIAPVKDTAHS